MSELDRYAKAMRHGNTGVCYQIELSHRLEGYAPDAVCAALKAFDDGEDMQDAIAEFYRSMDDDEESK